MGVRGLDEDAMGLSGRIIGAIYGSAIILSGCSASYINRRYASNVPVKQVTLACRDVYEVYDRVEADTLLVTSSTLTETTAGICGSWPSREARFRAVVAAYFADPGRPACRVLDVNELSPLHFEYRYRCA
jgi:hypothetical protein